MTSPISCGDCQHQSNSQIRPDTWLHLCQAGMKEGSGLRCLFGDFQRDFGRQVEGRSQGGSTSPVCLVKLRRLDKPLIRITIRLHQLAKPPADLTQPMLHSLLPAEAGSHDPQRGSKGAHQG